MADMLVRLYALPEIGELRERLNDEQIYVRRADTGEMWQIPKWVTEQFNASWAAGSQWSIARDPISCFVAVERLPVTAESDDPYDNVPPERLIGFACYDAAGKGIFGALGVHRDYRRRGIGRLLTVRALEAMREEGYVYGVIGWAGDPEFYANAVGATIIEGSEPGSFVKRLVV